MTIANHPGTLARNLEPKMTERIDTTLADLISAFYDEFLEAYGDEDLAAVATAATINDLLIGETAAAQEQAA